MSALIRFLMLATVFSSLCFAPAAQGETVDIMIVYDSTAKSWVDSNGGMNAFAADAVARMNQATANSNVNLTFRLVHAAVVSYTYSGALDTDLYNIKDGVGNLSVVHQWRDTYHADVVAMLVDTGSATGTTGIGFMLNTYGGQPNYAYSVSAVRSVDIHHTLTHEVGHNLGCDHSKFQASSPGPNTDLNTYSAGWYFAGTNFVKYHTIMAYSSDGYGSYYTEAPLFSTPLLAYQGTPAGHAADGDNARNIRETMGIVESYRAAPPPVNGACGSANGGSFVTVPTTNLCSTGTATAVAGSGPWTWSCKGSNGGSTAYCSAKIRTKAGLPWLQLLLGESSPPLPLTCPVISNGNFESGNTVWTSYSAVGNTLIKNSGFPVAVTPHGGSWAVSLGGPSNETSYIEQHVTVSSACPYLVYYYWISSTDFCGFDYGYMRINGTIWDTVNLCSLNNTGGWVAQSHNLSGYAGQTITLQFRATTDGSLNSYWFIDDVSFRKTP